jgi:hypothetical protein
MSRSRRLSGPLPSLCASLAALLLTASPAWSYIVFLKDGSQIQTKEKPRIEGEMAILILPSGTEASYQAAEIDFKKTEEINVIDYGTARLVEGLDKPKQLPKGVRFEDEPSFGEYISGRNLALPEVRKRQVVKKEDQLPTRIAGFVDLMAFNRSPYPSSEITGEVLGYLKGQGIERARIFQGTEADRALIEIVTPSEASAFQAIDVAAAGLHQIHERSPELIKAFELVLMTESQERAGQFLLTPERAELLVNDRLTVSQFFLRFVEF